MTHNQSPQHHGASTKTWSSALLSTAAILMPLGASSAAPLITGLCERVGGWRFESILFLSLQVAAATAGLLCGVFSYRYFRKANFPVAQILSASGIIINGSILVHTIGTYVIGVFYGLK